MIVVDDNDINLSSMYHRLLLDSFDEMTFHFPVHVSMTRNFPNSIAHLLCIFSNKSCIALIDHTVFS